MVSKKIWNINTALGVSYLIVLLAAFVIQVAFPFEITQEVLNVDNQRNYDINNIMSTIVGLMIMFCLGHLGFMFGVAKTEESLKTV